MPKIRESRECEFSSWPSIDRVHDVSNPKWLVREQILVTLSNTFDDILVDAVDFVPNVV